MAETEGRAADDVKGRMEESPEDVARRLGPILEALHRDLEQVMAAIERASHEVREKDVDAAHNMRREYEQAGDRTMKKAHRVPGEITEDGRLVLELPADLPQGRVAVTVEPVDENDFDVTDEDLCGLGLTAEEIAGAPEIGSWAGEPGLRSGAEFVERIRRAPVRYTW